MTSPATLRVRRPLPILFFSAFLALAGCATQAPGPVGPISTGNPRVDPVPGGEATNPDGSPIDEENMGELAVPEGPYTPPHMEGREIIRAGVLLPFTHPNPRVRQQAEGMLAGIELALFDYGNENIVLLPKDTGGSVSQATTGAEDLANKGVDIVLGPLFGANVQPVREALTPESETGFFGLGAEEPEEGKPVIAFSNDKSVASYGAWLASIAPEEEVAAIVEYAALRGYDQFAFFGPQSSLGTRIEGAMQEAVMLNGGFMLASGFYESGNTNPAAEAEYFATTIASAVEAGARVAVLVPERGNRLRRIAPLLAYYGVDTRQVKMLGTGGWNDEAVWREPSLRGAWFPTAPASDIADFEQSFTRLYGSEPSSLAAVAYDAAALVVALSQDGVLETEELINRDGFLGVNGLFRFRADGSAERSLAIMEIDPTARDGSGVREILPVSPSFDETIG
ncbi:MAG: penicillin-binding protein activator [Alphaproteobacteria bacterium]|jgi:ABC-type branched-subunit amino acid transport system substrate-binding protein|nr:penicillin-binding protein activator [Henriciella sp.]MBO6694236.1 penicillin-binding protein activator [Henriciella sp.]MCH9751449.1 penicillin-binding protein activator [Alphaproteobacteria bacterium]